MEFRILGSLEVVAGARTVALPGPKARALLAILLLRRNELVPTSRLIDQLWGPDWPSTAENAIHVYVSQLRRAFGAAAVPEDILKTGRRGYTLAVQPGAVDSERFETLAGLGTDALARDDPAHAAAVFDNALRLWRGPVLGDLSADGVVAGERKRLEERRLAVIEDRFDALLALGRHADSVADLEHLVAEHPLRERLHGQLLLALYRSGRQAEALDAYRRIRARLVESAGVEPGGDLKQLHRRILAQDPALSRRPSASQRAEQEARMSPKRTLAPRARTTFVGRQRELAEVTGLLRDPGIRLLVLTGPGGVGKTRLITEAAAHVSEAFPDGVVFVELAPLRDPRSLLPALAAALDVKEAGSRSLAQLLAERLDGSRMLIVLDSFERVVHAFPDVLNLIEETASLHVVATSRVALEVSPESIYELPPLGLPDSDAPSTGRSDAVSLFVERARVVRPKLELDARTAETVAACCVHLDGLPLAIELAAARLRVLSPDSLLERLTSSLDVLAGGGSASPPRHRTVRAAIDWSFELLSPTEQRVFVRLAVFAGGFTVADAEAVSPDLGGRVLDAVTSLLQAHLIYERTAVGDPRFAMLETVQQYALERLERSGQGADVSRRHAEHFAALAERLRPSRTLGAKLPDERAWISRLQSEHDNLRAALAWSITHDGETALRLVGELAVFWRLHGHLSEGRRWLDLCLRSTPGGSRFRILPLKGLSAIARIQGDAGAARAAAEELRALCRLEDDDKGVAHALNTLGNLATDRREFDHARAYYEESASLLDGIGDAWNAAGSRLNLGYLALYQDDYERAATLLETALAVFEQVSSNYGPSLAYHNLGLLELQRGRYGEAQALFMRAASLSLAVEFPSALADSLLGLAAVAEGRGRPRDAALILGAAEELWEQTVGVRIETSPVERRVYDRLVESLTASLGPAQLAEERARGGTVDPEELLLRAEAGERIDAVTSTG